MKNQRYQFAKEIYQSIGVDTDKAIEKLKSIPVSLHCWQGDDVKGFDQDGPLTGGIQTTGNYPGRARTPGELMEDMDILEAGIQIIAQPPGKKLQNMMQLSGGEKALTAISLLFAIQNLKPSPFCLLDEIEAALDDSNVVRFAQYLHKLTENTQFIVITHRRGTMTAADRLYGITMQEKGVSTLVSVDLLEDELDK